MTSGAAVNYQALEVYKKVRIMLSKWQRENGGKTPKYIFLSSDAYYILSGNFDCYSMQKTSVKMFMGVEVALVGVPGIYAAIGEDF